jgi:hypothetical protein
MDSCKLSLLSFILWNKKRKMQNFAKSIGIMSFLELLLTTHVSPRGRRPNEI